MAMSGAGLVLGTGGATEAFAFETLAPTSGAAVGCTAATYKNAGGNAMRAVFTVETASVRYRYDGTAPTTSVGHLAAISAGNTVSIIVEGAQNIANFKMIAVSTTAAVAVTYER